MRLYHFFRLFFAYLCLTIILNTPAIAQDSKTEWDVTSPDEHSSVHSFTVNEGTWINLDVSPDGKTIVFDLLGDIYTLSTEGGEAVPLRTGHAFEVQPRYSPDGNWISFTSDAGGGDNIWVMKNDGSEPKQVTNESFRLLNNAAWTPDGNYLIARKHFSSERSLGAGEIWMYHISGGSGLQLVKKMNDQQDINEPIVSPDGRYVYYSQDVYPGGNFQYNKDPNSVIYVIRRYDRETGEIETVERSIGGAARPQISKDGSKLAFIKRVREKTVLYIKDLESGLSYPVFDKLSKDQQEAWAIFGVYPNFNWLNEREIIIYGKGKMWKVNSANYSYEPIPFEVKATHTIVDAVTFKQPIGDVDFRAKAIRHATTSPDGKWIVFNATGFLWKKKLPDGKPERLTDQTNYLEFEPAFSSDGKSLVYSTWSDTEMGTLNLLAWGKSKSKKVTKTKGIFREPTFSPDGKHILFRKESGNLQQGFAYTQKPGIYLLDIKSGEESSILENGSRPVFNASGDRIFYLNGGTIFGSLKKSYKSVDLAGNDERTHFTAKYATQFTPSPDNKWVASIDLFKVYVAAMPMSGNSIELGANTTSIPIAQIAKESGVNLHWSADGRKLHWTMGETYYSAEVSNHFDFLNGNQEKVEPVSNGISINLHLKTDKPTGIIALTHVRIITMNAEKDVIEDGTIIIENERIKAVGKSATIEIPKSANVFDMTGKTIMPGLVDVHAHIGNFRLGLSPQQQWEYMANLAFGVTTAHDPSSNSEMIFSHSEMIRSGTMTGPRLFSTGVILYGAEGDFKAVINDYEDALFALKRTKAWGAFSVKSYNQPRRDQRQMVIKAARELEMMVYPEGGSFFYHNMSMILDGHTGIEHNIPIATLYDDVIQLWKSSHSGYTPTLIVNYGGLNGEFYFYQKSNVWENDHLLTFTPRSIIDSRSRHRTMVPDEEYENGHILVSESASRLMKAGVNLNLGAHGQLQGLGAHWELWMLHQGGISEMEALQAATINGANYLGMDHAIGSLETGKLADIIVLDKNPLENIYNTASISYTMINGRLYDAKTMNQLAPIQKERLPFWWEREAGGNKSFDWHAIGPVDQIIRCSCEATH